MEKDILRLSITSEKSKRAFMAFCILSSLFIEVEISMRSLKANSFLTGICLLMYILPLPRGASTLRLLVSILLP